MSGLVLLLAASLSLPVDAGVPDGSAGPGDGSAAAAADAHTVSASVEAGAPAPPAPSESAAPPAPPPRGRLEGRVLEKGTRRPVLGALMTIDLGDGAETDVNGQFAAVALCGPRRIAVQAQGFEPLLVERDPCADPSPLVLRLVRQQGGPVFKTTVRASTSLPSVTVQGPELVKTPGSLGDPFRVIESLPGVTSVVLPAPIFVVRGANPGNTGYFLDDVQVPALFHLALGPSVIHPYFFDSVDFYPGGYPARYGRYVAGIVTAQHARRPGRHGPCQRRRPPVRRRRVGDGPVTERPGIGRRRRPLLVHRRGDLVVEQRRPLQYWDYQLRADRNLGPVHLTLLAFGSSDILASTIPSASRTELALRFHRASLRAKAPVAGGVLIASVALGTDHTQAPLQEDYPLTIDSVGVYPRLGFRRPIPHATLEIGFDGQLQHFDASPRCSVRWSSISRGRAALGCWRDMRRSPSTPGSVWC